MSERVRLTGLWKNTDKNGNPYLSGSAGMAKIMIFPNTRKVGEKDPDYYLDLFSRDKQEGGERSGDRQQPREEENIPF